MKVVLDANVLIAALIARGVCCDLVEHCVVHRALISSVSILDDVGKHLVEKFSFTEEEAGEARDLFASQMVIVIPQKLERPVCRDPDDDLVLGTALAGMADYIVTGDKDLLVVKEYSAIKIVSPREFVELEFEVK